MIRIEDHTLQDTLNGIYYQVQKSVPFAQNHNFGQNIFDIFYNLKEVTKFANDKDGIEQVQSMQTLFGPNNIHGQPWYGDCDCFTVCVLTCLKVAGYDQAYIFLVGADASGPSHVYPAIDFMGTKFALDLTTNEAGMHRKTNSLGQKYKFKQIIDVYL